MPSRASIAARARENVHSLGAWGGETVDMLGYQGCFDAPLSDRTTSPVRVEWTNVSRSCDDRATCQWTSSA